MSLKPKQSAFVREYQMDHNGLQAAIRAGYSKKTAGSQACRLLKNVNVAMALGKAHHKAAAKVELTVDWVVEQLRDIAQDKRLKPTDRLSGLDKLMRHLGGFNADTTQKADLGELVSAVEIARARKRER